MLCKYSSYPGLTNTSIADTNHKLTIDDLQEVYVQLDDACTKWYNIGLALKLDVTALDKIESSKKDDVSACLREMLKHRLQADSSPLTWGDLCDSLRCCTVGRNDVAEKIEKWVNSKEVTGEQIQG